MRRAVIAVTRVPEMSEGLGQTERRVSTGGADESGFASTGLERCGVHTLAGWRDERRDECSQGKEAEVVSEASQFAFPV